LIDFWNIGYYIGITSVEVGGLRRYLNLAKLGIYGVVYYEDTT